MTQALRFQHFDTEAFGIPFYRVVNAHSMELERELQKLESALPFIVDAKLPAEDIQNGRRLMKLGFRKVCTQIELHRFTDRIVPAPTRSKILKHVALSEAIIRAHAANFVFNRFSLDILFPCVGYIRLYEKWIRNSLEGGNHLIAICGNDFITHKDDPPNLSIDLTSVLSKGQGVGTDLLNATLAHARQRNIHQVKVVTECENRPAIMLYMKSGFVPVRFFSVFHLFRTSVEPGSLRAVGRTSATG